jgi:hypothetical protein
MLILVNHVNIVIFWNIEYEWILVPILNISSNILVNHVTYHDTYG